MPLTINKYRFSSSSYHEMIELGILGENDRVELIEGEIIAMAAIESRHAACVNQVNRLLNQHLRAEWIISVQNPIALSDGNEPEPDIALLRFQSDFYAKALPRAQDTLLVIEVADSSLEYDQTIKLPLYAKTGISELWIIDLNQNLIHQYLDPTSNTYRHKHTLDTDAIINASALPISLSVKGLLP